MGCRGTRRAASSRRYRWPDNARWRWSDATPLDVPRLLVHAIWWEQNSTDGEGARYALVAIDKGVVSSPDVHAMSEFVLPAERQNVNDDFNHDFLRHPTIIENSDSNSADVVFV